MNTTETTTTTTANTTVNASAAGVRHVVLGGGPAGTTVAVQLADAGATVRLVQRTPDLDDDRIDVVAADISEPEAAIAATDGTDVIYHCINVGYHLQTTLLPGLTEAILAAATAHDAKLVVLDTLYPYGQADGDAITERTPWAATSRKGMMRAELDRRYLLAHGTHEARVTIGRAADFFGPRVFNSTLGATFFPAVLTGEPALGMGDLSLPHSYSYIGDVARALIELGTNPAADGHVWHLPTVPAVSTNEIHSIVAELIGHDVDVTEITEPVPAGPFDQQFMDEYAEMFYQHQIPQNMVSDRFQTRFGIEPTPLSEALAATLSWYRAVFGIDDTSVAATDAATEMGVAS